MIRVSKLFFICILCLLLVSCNTASAVSQSFYAMDTFMSATLYGQTNISGVQSVIEEIERKYSATRPGSLVYRLNLGETVEADEGLCEMLALAQEMKELTDGAYDISVLPLMKLYGFGGENRVPSDAEIASVIEKMSSGSISVTESSVTLNGGAEIDLGSCAKGYAGDKAIEYLKSFGVSCAVLNLGGSVHTLGQKPDGSAFRIGIADPNAPAESFAELQLGECAVVTSGTYQRYFEAGGERYHHLLDARTGKCSESDYLSVTVVIKYEEKNAGLRADFLSSAMFLLGSERAEEFQRQNGSFEMVAVKKNGEIFVSKGLENCIKILQKSAN